MQLHFVRFDVESRILGCSDYVRVHDGINTKAPELATLCGTELPKDVVSSENSLLVVFATDRSVTRTGFKIKYTAKPILPGI